MKVINPPAIRRRFEVTFPSVAIETTANYDQTIAQVMLDRSIIALQTERDSNGSAWAAPAAFANFGVKLLNATTARLVAQNTYLNAGGGSANMVAQVVEFVAKPKSLQYALANGSNQVSLAKIDPTKAVVIPAFLAAQDNTIYTWSLGATALTWSASLASPIAVWVIEF